MIDEPFEIFLKRKDRKQMSFVFAMMLPEQYIPQYKKGFPKHHEQDTIWNEQVIAKPLATLQYYVHGSLPTFEQLDYTLAYIEWINKQGAKAKLWAGWVPRQKAIDGGIDAVEYLSISA